MPIMFLSFCQLPPSEGWLTWKSLIALYQRKPRGGAAALHGTLGLCEGAAGLEKAGDGAWCWPGWWCMLLLEQERRRRGRAWRQRMSGLGRGTLLAEEYKGFWHTHTYIHVGYTCIDFIIKSGCTSIGSSLFVGVTLKYKGCWQYTTHIHNIEFVKCLQTYTSNAHMTNGFGSLDSLCTRSAVGIFVSWAARSVAPAGATHCARGHYSQHSHFD